MVEDQPGDSAVEELMPGLTRQWLKSGRIVSFRLANTRRDTIDAWLAAILHSAEEMPPGAPYLVLHDVSNPNLALTPYLRTRARDFLRLTLDRPGCGALVVSTRLLEQVVNLFLKVEFPEARLRKVRVFAERDAALQWLLDACRDALERR